MNQVSLVGRLTADPELKNTQNGISVCSCTVAVDRQFQKDGEREADFINIVVWRNTAEFLSKYFSKGKPIALTGSIQTRKYKDKEGNNRTAFEVVADNVHFVPQDKKAQSIDVEHNNFEAVEDDSDLPF